MIAMVTIIVDNSEIYWIMLNTNHYEPLLVVESPMKNMFVNQQNNIN